MQHRFYKLLLYLLQGLVYLKRALIWVLHFLGAMWGRFSVAYHKTLGFYLYKLWFSFRKRWERVRIPWDGRLVGVLTQRNSLQILLFFVGLAIMLPHSQLAPKNTDTVHGRGTVLYTLVGPGDEFETIEEFAVEATTFTQKETRSWREGAVMTDTPAAATADPIVQNTEIAGIGAGGSAMIKPTIIPGSDLPEVDTHTDDVFTSKRREVIEYTVQPGDVIGKIAQKFDISVTTILTANKLSARSYIRPGQELTILPTSGVLHKVKKGDTVKKIARTYNAKEEDIVQFNRLQGDGSDIVIGEELVIPGGAKKQPVYVKSVPTPKPSALANVVAPPPSVAAPAGSGYIWPTNVRRITQYYGWRHTGIDIAGPSGSPLYAARAGRVIKSQCGWNGGYGCYIIVDHGAGVHTLYAHALTNGLLVSVGEQVVQGQTIALMGSTGRSTGPHIHFEVRVNGRRVNPYQYIR